LTRPRTAATVWHWRQMVEMPEAELAKLGLKWEAQV
jgi:hypothetical protein